MEQKVVQRFLRVDPLADQFPGWSPYNYTLNNPINLIDPDGRAPGPPGAIVGVERLGNGNFSHYSVSATVYIYGAASSPDLASTLTTNVNAVWNNSDNPAGTRRRAGQDYSPVKFDINFVHVSVDEAKSLAGSNTDKAVNFMNIIDQDGASSFFEGNSGQLNLQMDRERGNTTSAHEIGHMMGFRSPDANDETHTTDQMLQGTYNGVLPLMYSGGDYFDNLGQRTRTSADVQWLNIWQNKWQGDGYLGEDINNVIYD